MTGDLDAAVSGASFVLLQLRVGGQSARLRDETIPLACGCIGQETTGAGGFAKAMRTVPVVLEIAERVRALAEPDAWIVDFTNPVGIVTRALLDAGHRAIGLCNVAIGVQREVARLLAVAPERVLVDHVGLNHLTWVRRVLVDGDDVLPELLDRHGEALAAHADLPLRLLEELGAIPSSYLRYFYAHDAVLEEQRDGMPRATVVAEIEARLLEIYRDAEVSEKPALLEQRGGAFYSEAATQLIASLSADTGDVQVADVRNGDVVEGLKPDDVVELPVRVGAAGPVPLPQAPLAPELLGLVQHVAAYERLAAEAAVTRDPVTARKALLAHPLIGQDELAGALLGAPARRGAAVRRRSGTMSNGIVLAVDGGNSKTDLALVREDGELLAHVRGPLSSPHHLGLGRVGAPAPEPSRRGADRVGNGRPPMSVAEIFLAGVDFPAEEEQLRAELVERELAGHVVVGNDTLALLRAGTERGWGVAVVCGAGINCVGVGPDGRHVRFPALGAITGDWGGGYDVGSEALCSQPRAARTDAARGRASSRRCPRHFGLDRPARWPRRCTPGGSLTEG